MPAQGPAFAQLRQHLHQTRLLGSISSALYYDQNTVMPSAGAPWRGEQLALLAEQLHERQSSGALCRSGGAAEAELRSGRPPAAIAAICSCCGWSSSASNASIPPW